jgi:hypothetical protein
VRSASAAACSAACTASCATARAVLTCAPLVCNPATSAVAIDTIMRAFNAAPCAAAAAAALEPAAEPTALTAHVAPTAVSSRIAFVRGEARDVDAARLYTTPAYSRAGAAGLGNARAAEATGAAGAAGEAEAAGAAEAASPAGGMTLRGRPRRSASILYV